MSQTTSEPQQEYFNNNEQLNQINSEDHDLLTLRSLVSTKEAGVIIGKGGKTIAEIRDSTGVKLAFKIVQGIPDCVLTVTGTLEGVASAYSLIAKSLLDNQVISSSSLLKNNTSINQGTAAAIRLLISHNLMGTIIGREGKKIKLIQDETGVKIVASKTLLSQSTERVVEICGNVEGIRTAILDVGQCLMNDKERAFGTILYNPLKAVINGENPYTAKSNRRVSLSHPSNGNVYNNNNNNNNNNYNNSHYSHPPPHHHSHHHQHHYKNMSLSGNGHSGGNRSRRFSTQSQSKVYNNEHDHSDNNGVDMQTFKKAYPTDMVGPIIGKAGSKISEIRQLSSTRIAIAKVTDDDSGEREFTIQGSHESIQQAIVLIDDVVKKETERRSKLQNNVEEGNADYRGNEIDELELTTDADTH
ncbi:unnamed protein product [Cunninghamella echinulata]